MNQGSETVTRAGGVMASIGGCGSGCNGVPGTIVLWDDGAAPGSIPTLSDSPPEVTGGETITIRGSGFLTGEGSPLAWIITEAEGARIYGTVSSFSDSELSWTAPTTALVGPATLFVAAGAVVSSGTPIAIRQAKQATACGQDAECATGFCTDGFCCDQRCGDKCQGCSAARKKGGADGVCGAVPPGEDIKGLCFALQGEACTDVSQCATGFCVEGVCCNAACQGACLSCTQKGTVGQCTGIQEGACDVACDGDHTLKKVGSPDVDCTPFKCAGKTCRPSCTAVNDCVAPYVCTLQGVCAPGVNAAPADVSVWGCGSAGDSSPNPGANALAAMGVWVLLSRRRRR
jgi:uncharacterized protein (TIGR03382 family)